MPENIFKIVEVVGVSKESIQQAVRNAIARSRETLRNVAWFEVSEIRGRVDEKGTVEFQAQVRVGFRLEGPVD